MMKTAVLVPVYNAGEFLRECLESLLANEVDVFCLNDGSTDGSQAILDDYAAKHGRIHVSRQENAGVSAARNRLMDALPPDYGAFAFCDADDTVRPGMYAKLAEAMSRTGADVAETEWSGDETVLEDMSVYLLRRTAVGGWINVINKLYRRSAVGAIRFREELKFEEDYYFNFEIHQAIRRKVLVPGSFYFYRSNPNSATSALDFGNYLESASRRVQLSNGEFLGAGRIPERLVPDFRREMAKDAYRMCIRKNLKKNRNPVERKRLFQAASEILGRLEREQGFAPVGLNPVQRLLYACCLKRLYGCALAVSLLT